METEAIEYAYHFNVGSLHHSETLNKDGRTVKVFKPEATLTLFGVNQDHAFKRAKAMAEGKTVFPINQKETV